MIKGTKIRAVKTDEVTISQATALDIAYNEVLELAGWGHDWGVKDGKLCNNTNGVDWKGRSMGYVRDATELDLATWLILSKLKGKSYELLKGFSENAQVQD